MKINKLLFSALVMLGTFGVLSAQEAGQTKVSSTNDAFEKLELTEEQEVKMQEIKKRYELSMKEVRVEFKNENAQGLRSALQSLQEKQQKEIRAVFTESQLGSYDKMMKKRNASRAPSPVKKTPDGNIID